MKSIGVDIVQIARIEAILAKQGDRFVQRILTDAEQAVYEARKRPVQFLANRYAAKEALAKALGTGIAQGLRFTHMSVLPDELGAPRVELSGVAAERLAALGAHQALISISDEQDYAVAFVTLI